LHVRVVFEWYLTGFVRERGDSVDAEIARPVSVAGAVRRGGFRSDPVHVTDCGEGPLAQSWRNIDIRALHGEVAFFVASENSNVTDVGRAVHSCGIDTTTLSAECQQPCHPIRRRDAGTLESVAPQGFSQHRQTLGRDPLEPAFLGRLCSPPRTRQGFANTAPRVRYDDPPSELGDTETKGLSSTLPPPTDQLGRDRTSIPARSAASNPLTRVSATLSPECQEPSN